MTEEIPQQEPKVPLSELEDLLRTYRGRHQANLDKFVDTGIYHGIAVGRARSAKELQELIEDYKE